MNMLMIWTNIPKGEYAGLNFMYLNHGWFTRQRKVNERVDTNNRLKQE